MGLPFGLQTLSLETETFLDGIESLQTPAIKPKSAKRPAADFSVLGVNWFGGLIP